MSKNTKSSGATEKRRGKKAAKNAGAFRRMSLAIAAAWGKVVLLASRMVYRVRMRRRLNNIQQTHRAQGNDETAQPTWKGAAEPSIGEPDAPAYVLGCSTTAAGVIATMQDRGEKYPSG
jgi:hypothetical protein